MASNDHIPQHVAIIMDGNGRWARKRALPRHAGHRSGVGSVRQAVETAAQRGVKVLTLFAFSSENWSRPREEVSKLMGLFVEALQREVDELHLNNVRLEFVGARELLQASLVEKIASAEEQTRENTGLRLLVAVAYGGRWDIAQAAKRLAGRAVAGEIAVEDIDDAAVAHELQLRDVPDPDLLIRTGGEQRISNFLLWHLAYSELYFCDTLWPDFGEVQFDAALEFFAQRQRRYGHTAEQVEAVGS
ncbi:MAG: di-trans,poly-cis-decaprenylcistransferase [Desulfobulbaceae bacterium]|nr:di-trans,poly-cis-decaprenylcistransferase [Desulfobulbaceae bacterium]